MDTIGKRSRLRWITTMVNCLSMCVYGQVSITTGSYTQDFGTIDRTTWTNNGTYPGWYRSGSLIGHLNITNTAPTNTGGFYTYECNGNNDQKIGSRSSGGTGLGNIRYGVVLRNTTGLPIQSIQVSYRGYQLSLAENGNVQKRLQFDYVISSSIPGIGATSTASVTALDFIQVENSSAAGDLQIQGFPCTRYRDLSRCIVFSTPLAHNSYILLRWADVNTGNNEHHMAIDDVKVDFDLTGTACTTLLPIELLYFNAEPSGSNVRLDWATASEKDNAFFIVHRGGTPFSMYPILQQAGAGTTQRMTLYEDLDRSPLPSLSYYRLQQVDIDGSTSWSDIVAVQRNIDGARPVIHPNPSVDGRFFLEIGDEPWLELEVYEASGHLIHRTSGPVMSELDLSGHPSGTYVVRYLTERTSRSVRIQKTGPP